MDDASIHGELAQIFPHLNNNVIQRTIEEAKASNDEAVNILTRCIDLVLDRQADYNFGRQKSDDVIVVKSIKKKHLNGSETRDIPFVYIREDSASSDRDHCQLDIFSDCESDSEQGKQFISEIQSSDDEETNSNSNFRITEHRPVEAFAYNNNQRARMDQVQAIGKLETPFSEALHHDALPETAIQPTHTDTKIQTATTTYHHQQTLAAPKTNLCSPPLHSTITKQPCMSAPPQPPSSSTSTDLVGSSAYSNNQRVRMDQVQATGKLETPFSEILHHDRMPETAIRPVHHYSKMRKQFPTLKTKLSSPPQQSTTTKQPCMSAPSQLPSSSTSTDLVGSSALNFVQQIFPNVNIDFVNSLSQQGHDLNVIVNTLLERSDMQNSCPSEPLWREAAQTKKIDYFKEYSKKVSPMYFDQCLALLKNEFRRVSVSDIRYALKICNGHYAPSRKLLEEALLALNESPCEGLTSNCISSSVPSEMFRISRLIASKRPCVSVEKVLDDDLQLEVDFVKAQAVLKEDEKNAIYAAHINQQQYKDEGQLIECGCCFGEFPFEEIIQCSDGHLFCKECLHGYAKEIIFGSSIASVNLTCMGEECDKPFPYSQLEKCLTKEEIEKYQGRLQEDCLAKADIANLYQCPFCEFAAIVPEREKVFSCLNLKCGKESCKECKEPWKDHFGLKCSEIEKKSQTNLRRSYEEKMTLAKVRKCLKCSLTFTKLDGCNKMTCRCGTTQCYVCRQSHINYSHFCRHPRDPGKKCNECTACSLWTDPTEDDELAIKQLQEEAAVAKRKLDEEIELEAKKQKV